MSSSTDLRDAKLEEFKNNTAAFLAADQSIIALASAIDPNSPDAQSSLDTALQESTAKKKEILAEQRSILSQLNMVRGQLLPGEDAIITSTLKESISAIDSSKQELSSTLNSKQAAITAAKPESTVKTPEATNPSATDTASAEKQATATIEGTPPAVDDRNEADKASDAATAAREAAEKRSKPSSQPPVPKVATPVFQGGKDHRVRLKVPTTYLVGQAAGPNSTLVKSQGIIFPYTPSIGQEYTATYNSVPITHSNYAQYFYKNSSVGTISLSAKFTVQNDYEAEVFFSVVHLLRALTKMRYGDDDNAGSPPPVCRLFAYGDAIMNNVPVAISSFKLELPDNVDYFTTKSQSSAPTLSTIALTLTPIYSRNEMQKFTVTDWLSNNLRSKGYL